LRWWDQYLKGEDRGVDRDPAMRLWLQDYAAPQPFFLERPGRWLAFAEWPSGKLGNQSVYPLGSTLSSLPSRGAHQPLTISSPQTVGIKGQEWCPYGQGRLSAEGATDQREDDGASLCFSGPPLTESLNIVGQVRVHLRIAADRPQAMVAVRLCDIAPGGTSSLITFGLLNLSHRDSHEHPTPLKPGEFYSVIVELKPIAQNLPKDHSLRIAISSAYWPMAWPSPELVTLYIDAAQSRIDLPIIDSTTGFSSVEFTEPEYAKPGGLTIIAPPRNSREISNDVERQKTAFNIHSDDGRYIIDEIGTEIASNRTKIYEITRNDPTSAISCVLCHHEYRRGTWNARVDTKVSVTSDKTHFHIAGTVRAFENDEPFASRDFAEIIPRDHL
jgi:predicted acyl esterase